MSKGSGRRPEARRSSYTDNYVGIRGFKSNEDVVDKIHRECIADQDRAFIETVNLAVESLGLTDEDFIPGS